MGETPGFLLLTLHSFPSHTYGVSFLYSRTGPVAVLLTPVAAGQRYSAGSADPSRLH